MLVAQQQVILNLKYCNEKNQFLPV